MNATPEGLVDAVSDRYRIEGEIGHGGMATVYLAHDVRHDRKVAIKALRPELAAIIGADRFLREIRTTANLQHPNILPLFDSGEAGGVLWFAMPHIEGESLRSRLDREHQLPVDEAVRIATEVATALDFAHRRGIVHRDIKPANILLQDGRALVADFGIALAVSAAGGSRLTETGFSLGTPAYMSPEQAAGDPHVDRRSDVYSLGCALYEMLAGEPPFAGRSAQAILAKALSADPRPLREVRSSVPAHLEAAITKAIHRIPADRFSTAGEFAAALDDARPARNSSGPLADRAGLGVAVRAAPWVAAAGLLAWVILRPPPAVERQAVGLSRHVSILLPDSVPLVFTGVAPGGIGQPALALSPDGRQLVYVGPADSTTRLYVRSLETEGVEPVPGTEGAVQPFFSPDGRSIGYSADNVLYRVSLDGRSPIPVTEADWAYGATWNEQDHIAAVSQDSRFLVVSGSLGGPSSYVLPRGTGVYLADPQWLPGDEWVLATCYLPFRICAFSTRTHELRDLTVDGEAGASDRSPLMGTSPRLVGGRYLVFSDHESNIVRGIRFDPRRLATRGQPVELLRDVRRENAHGSLQLSVSENGDLVYAPGTNAIQGRLMWVDRTGTRDTLPYAPRIWGGFSLSPDARRVAIIVSPPLAAFELWLLDLERGDESRWSLEGIGAGKALLGGVWFPDSRRFLVTLAVRDSTWLYRLDAGRRGSAELLWAGRGTAVPDRIYRDGTLLLTVWGDEFYVAQSSIDSLATLPADAASAFPALFDDVGSELFPDRSPDGRWLLYLSDVSGPLELWARRLPVGPDPIKVVPGGSEIARWSPVGDAIYFRRGQRFFRASFDGTSRHPFGAPELVAEGNFLNVPGPELEVHADGRRLLLIGGPEERATTRLILVENWVEQVRAKLGGG
jgi:hypothetical protein